MRKSINGLSIIVSQLLGRDPFGVFQDSFRLNIFNPYFPHDLGSIKQSLLASSFVLI
jgi:hypothetical protein